MVLIKYTYKEPNTAVLCSKSHPTKLDVPLYTETSVEVHALVNTEISTSVIQDDI